MEPSSDSNADSDSEAEAEVERVEATEAAMAAVGKYPHAAVIRSFCSVMALLLAICIGLFASDIRKTMRYDLDMQFNDNSCTLLETPTPCEDLTAVGDGERAFAGGGDFWNTLMHGSAGRIEGAVWLVNAKTGTIRAVPIEASAPGGRLPRLLLHGLFYSQASQRLYAVNHDEAAGESVEIFDVVGSGDGLALQHLLSLRSPLFGNMALNDVVEGRGDELYVTEWQPFPFPAGGKNGTAAASLRSRLQRMAVAPISLLKLPLTRVFRCTYAVGRSGAAPACAVASEARFVMANGIAISHDRRSVFVNDPISRAITVLERGPAGSLTRVSSFETKHAVDNIEMGPDGRLHAGAMPFLYTSASVCEEARPLSATRVVDGREIRCGKSPGSMLRISLLGTGGRSFVDGTQTDVLVHDGSLLSGATSALQLGGRVLLGSADAPGVLLCDVAEA